MPPPDRTVNGDEAPLRRAHWRRGLYNVLPEDGRAAPVAGAGFTASIFSLLGVEPLLVRPLI